MKEAASDRRQNIHCNEAENKEKIGSMQANLPVTGVEIKGNKVIDVISKFQ